MSYTRFIQEFGKAPVTIGSLTAPVHADTHTVVTGQATKEFIAKSEQLKTIVPNEANSGYSWMIPTGGEGKHARVSVISVPTETSRHNCPSRPDALVKSFSSVKADIPTQIVCAVKVKADVLPTALAVYGSFPFVTFKSDEKHKGSVKVSFEIESGESLTDAEIDEIRVIGENARLAQGLSDLPPNVLNPESFVDYVLGLIEGVPGVTVKVIEDCEAEGLMGIHTVGKASKTAPRMIVLTHSVDAAGEGGKSVTAVVGKGITYDTGGLSLKPSASMKGMKRDMGGAAAALGSFLAMARLPRTTPATLHCVLCIAENSLGSASYRNDDVVTLYSGKSVEINNTDAEGRLLLADGVAYASKKLGADVIVDIAALTGAAAVASGKDHASFVSTDAALADRLKVAGIATGDLVHELVFCPELHRPNLKSAIADMKNSTITGSDAPASAAATFVYDHLIGAGFKGGWVHVDMASVVERGERSTGYGVALLTQFLRK